MTAVYLLRHPETTWNATGRYQGRLEAPLSAQGRRQARLLAASFEGQRFDAIVSSPLIRAWALAVEVAETSRSSLRVDTRLTEIGMGLWEGLFHEEIEGRHSDLYRQWHSSPGTVIFPGGEGLRDVSARACSALADVFDAYRNGHVAIVTHSAVIQVLVALALGLDFNDVHLVRVSNASVTTLCGEGPPGSLLTLNAMDAVYGSPVQGAIAQDCVSWKRRRITA